MNNLAMFKMCKPVGLFILLLGIALLNNISIPHGNAALKSNIVAFARQLSELSEIVHHYCPKTNSKEGNSKNPVDEKKFSEVYSKLKMLEAMRNYAKFTYVLKNDITNDLSAYNSLLAYLYVATKYKYPKADKEKLWKECREELKKEFQEVNDYYERICKDYEHTRIASGYSFSKKLEKYVKLWREVAFRNEIKWKNGFSTEIRNYKPKKNQSHNLRNCIKQMNSGTKKNKLMNFLKILNHYV
ncbi:RAD protein [Plasmodium cynomolgi strain B]|uniref:RAD protein n=1 Tax=Plasmodium cynomolgi (strain B) TaxID=1120755 RepID=K6VJ33_PLACD|nr:RAD protein [Plasmodium cynomolgi strain B]GAB69402.1 RAD protein [Plasmodium cynomolgi strain B]